MVNLKKVVNKIINYFYNRKYGPKNYPEEFKYIIAHCKKNKVNLDRKFKKSVFSKKENIKLASKYIKKNSQNFWKNLKFVDNEDKGYIHRWSWALNLISKKKNKKKKYISSVINDWFFNYQDAEFDNNKIEWYPYNISERISNYVLLCELKIIKNNKSNMNHLTSQMYFLSQNIEFYKDKKSNHTLNNARAIFLLSCLSKNKIFKIFSINLILFLCKKFMDKDGFFKFGSSHYQFIFTKWLVEIYYFGKKYKVKQIVNLKKYLHNSIQACNFFIQKNNYGKLTYPLFGNISPDFTPEFLLNYLKTRSKKNNLSINSKNYNKEINGNKEWIKLKNNFQTIIFRNPLINKFDFNHAHSDFFHFVNFYKGNPIFVDIGRKDYLTKHLDYSLAQAHNSIMINKSGIFDGFIKKNFFTKIGIYELNKENYTVKHKKNKIEFKALLSDKSTIIRTFELQNKAIIIENEFNNMSQKNRIDIPLFIDNKIKIKKIDKTNILLSSKLFKSSLSIKGENNSLKIEIFNNKQYYKFSQCRSYGESENLNLINLSFLGKEYFKTTLKLNFLD
jgi:hypothetical protein